MAEISQGEKVLLGYSPNSITCTQGRNSDDDFSDVFGGPPRRSSTQEYYSTSARNSFDVIPNVDYSEAQRSMSSSTWFGLREKPVFGVDTGLHRRYAATGDFFDDIFRGDQPLSPSCTNKLFPSSAPGSRAMSPSRTLVSTPEPLASPTKFSLPSGMISTDFMATTSINQSSFNPARSRFNKTMSNRDGRGHSSQSSSLSRQVSADGKEAVSSGGLLDGIADRPDISYTTVKASQSPDIGNTNFHFSIFKWPSKGVPLVMSLRKRNSEKIEATKVDTFLSNTKQGVLTGVLPPELVNDSEHGSDSTVRSNAAACKLKDDIDASPEFESAAFTEPENREDEVQETTTLYGSEDAEKVPEASEKTSFSVRNSVLKTSSRKSNMRPLGSFFKEEKNGDKTVSAEQGIAKTTGKELEKKPVPDNAVPSQKVHKTKIHDAFRSEGKKNDHPKGDGAGTVMEFVKIFNQETPHQASTNAVGRSQGKKWKSAHTFEVDYELRSLSATTKDEMQPSYVNWEEPLPNISQVVDESSLTSGKQQDHASGVRCAPETATTTSINEPKADCQRVSAADMNATSDETLDYETKVLQWSKGKEGNIRALLSTLQYVLWPNTGWKPIPLVDIIEGNAVKRAYQRALLCLHPDKLQQKGAPTYHKFIAEKVFDIIQEAWDQFNSLGPLYDRDVS